MEKFKEDTRKFLGNYRCENIYLLYPSSKYDKPQLLYMYNYYYLPEWVDPEKLKLLEAIKIINMNPLIDIGYILIDNIINIKNDTNKTKLLSAVKNHNKHISDKKEELIEKQNIYINDYETPRKKNIDNYNKYLRNKEILYNKWKTSKAVKDLYELISLKQPEYTEIPNDIYSVSVMKKKKTNRE